uniref:Uncharacterized protein n=1 Tax=Setaria digitata TaxID=48799 RepID=A0A915PRI7_9BILA
MGEMDDTMQGGSKGSIDDDQMKSFVSSGRTGRRNAVPEVDIQEIDPEATKLADRLSSMNTYCRDDYSNINRTDTRIMTFQEKNITIS